MFGVYDCSFPKPLLVSIYRSQREAERAAEEARPEMRYTVKDELTGQTMFGPGCMGRSTGKTARRKEREAVRAVSAG